MNLETLTLIVWCLAACALAAMVLCFVLPLRGPRIDWRKQRQRERIENEAETGRRIWQACRSAARRRAQ